MIVLRRRNFGEADRILTVLTPIGKFGAIAKGVRRLKSKLASGIEPYGENDVVLIEGRGELLTLSSARPIGMWKELSKSIDLQMSIAEMIRVLDRHVENGSGGDLYPVLANSLDGLDKGKSPALIEVWFYLQVLRFAGFAPELKKDKEGQPLDSAANYSFDIGSGRLVAVKGGKFGADHIKLWRLCLTNPIEVILGIKGAETAANESIEPLKRFAGHQFS